MRDFSNQTLQEEWNKFRTDVLNRRNERVQRRAASLQQQQATTDREIQEMKQKLESLQSTVDKANADFADGSIALEYDADRVLQALDPNSGKMQPLSQCLGERAHWIDCSKKYSVDTRPCDAYLKALEVCVQNTILSKTAAE